MQGRRRPAGIVESQLGETEHLHGDAHQCRHPFVGHHPQGLSGVGHRTVRDAGHVHAGKAFSEQVADAARQAARQQDEHPVARPDEGRHAVVEEVAGEFLIAGREVDALGRPRGARGGQGDDALHVVLAHADQVERGGADVVGGREGELRQVVEAAERDGALTRVDRR